MNKKLVFALGLGTALASPSLPAFAAGDGAMDMGGMFAMRQDRAKEIRILNGTLNYRSGELRLLDEQGKSYLIINPSEEALSMVGDGKTQVAIEGTLNDGEIKLIRIRAL